MSKNVCGILCHKERWHDVRNNPKAFAPHPSLIVDPLLFSGYADRLTRHAGAD
jgi:hypothetical protein